MNTIKTFFSQLGNRILSAFKRVPSQAGSAASSRQARYGGISLVSLLAVMAIIVFVNLIVKNAGYRWDLTKNKLYSLSPETIKVIKNLSEDTKAMVFISNNPATSAQKEEIKKLLDEYSSRTTKIKYEFIDPNAKQALAIQYGIQRQGTVVFTQGNRVEQTTSNTEQDYTAALIKLKNPNNAKVVFWVGNGEKDPTNQSEEGYSEIKTSLERLNYQVLKQDTSKDATIASDTAVLVIAGPRVPYVQRYIDALSNYLNRGGRVLVMLETIENFQKTGLEDLLAKYGVATKQGVVLDPELNFTDVGIPGVDTYPVHQITQGLSRTVYVNPIMVKPTDKLPDGMDVESIVKTSKQSWLETSLNQNPTLDEKAGDVVGPVSIAVATKYSKSSNDVSHNARLVVIGDSDSGSNLVVQYNPSKSFVLPGNLDLVVNSINWLASKEDLISITPKDTAQPTITLSSQQARQLQYLVLVGMPGIFLILALIVWRRRRRLRG